MLVVLACLTGEVALTRFAVGGTWVFDLVVVGVVLIAAGFDHEMDLQRERSKGEETFGGVQDDRALAPVPPSIQSRGYPAEAD